MSPHGRYEDLKEEIENMQIRPGDMGDIKGKFEHHFFGSGNGFKLSKDLQLTYREWKLWYDRALCIIRDQQLGPTMQSRALDRSFQRHFAIRLPPRRHITPELCSSWHETHLAILTDIWKRRQLIGGTRKDAN